MHKVSFQGEQEGQQENLAAEEFQKRYLHVEGKGLINRVTAVKLICRSEVLSQGTVTYFLNKSLSPTSSSLLQLLHSNKYTYHRFAE